MMPWCIETTAVTWLTGTGSVQHPPSSCSCTVIVDGQSWSHSALCCARSKLCQQKPYHHPAFTLSAPLRHVQ